ncbi:DUF5008 domain-containing protein [Niabella pedocola]|uniref:DUF5008 domain-containing protein n=1 Tax=Niabella pedocola TaxID=1752077 RepID=A0ABS8PQM6_9BACT|nr:DUF5008 domain-containing protein [Niabella pedocola]MCD2423387.1 DUF5008 domain-containing protein [Niabella pedocola]
MARHCFYIALLTVGLATAASCNKSSEIYDDPYGGGQNVIEIDFLNTPPVPANGEPGQSMTFSVKGLKPEMKDKIAFMANGMPAAISGFTDSTITIVLPDNVSSGGASLRVDGQVFLGPAFMIRGKLGLDPTFNPGSNSGSVNLVNQIVPLPNGNFMLAGNIYAFQGKVLRDLVQMTPTGGLGSTLNTGTAADMGSISSLLRLPSGDFLAGGVLSSYNGKKGINGMVRLNADASLKTRIVELYVSPGVSDPTMASDTVSYFNGNLLGGVGKLFYYNNQVTAVGGISGFGTYFYERSTKDNRLFDYIANSQVVRMDADGNLDSAYSYNTTAKTPLPAGNGNLSDGLMQEDGKLILTGAFTTFRGKQANRIVRLNTDGTVDGSFQAGTGANGAIFSIRYNTTTKKIVITGEFSKFNDQDAAGIAVLDANGNLDTGFKSGGFSGGAPTLALQLSNGLIVVTGSFEKYNTITRQGLLVLNTDGTLAGGYNATGKLNALIRDMVETKSGVGSMPAVLLGGVINTFEGQPMGCIMKLVLNN